MNFKNLFNTNFPMRYSFNVKEPYKTFLLTWQKVVEGRLNKWKFKKIKPGDILYFQSGEEFKVIWKNIYNSFYEMLENEGLKNVLPDKDDILEWVKVYYKFYSKEMEQKYWVVAIKVRRIN